MVYWKAITDVEKIGNGIMKEGFIDNDMLNERLLSS